MIEVDQARAPATAVSAGSALRAARERQGVHVAALAAGMKVPTRMLEALEADRLEELPDLTFARALAQSMCRVLRVDAQPVLALLPRAGANAQHLEQVSSGLAAPFHDRPGRREPGLALMGRPVLWATLAVLVAAAVVALWPERAMRTRLVGAEGPAGAGSAPAGSAPASGAEPAPSAGLAAPGAGIAPAAATAASGAASAMVETVFSTPANDGAAPSAAAVGPLVLRASAETWVEALDGSGQVLLSRNVQAGETLTLDGALPLRLRIGNVAGTALSFRGQPVDLQSLSRDNTARVELK